MKLLLLLLVTFLLVNIPDSFSELDVSTNSKVYSPNHNLQVYGVATSEENIILRIFAPDGTITKFDQLTTDVDGTFNYNLLTWPQASTEFPYGTYLVEVISTQYGESKQIEIKFAETTNLEHISITRDVITTVFAPETVAINQPFRVFIQLTSDGLLLGNDLSLLTSTHVHLPSGFSVLLSDSLNILHQGLYYIDYLPTEEGTFVFHVVTSTQGTVSHGSAATNVLSQDLGGISDQIIRLELDILKTEISGFGNTLNNANDKLDSSIGIVSTSVEYIGEASSQLNALLFPIIASIGIIVALQITIIARNR